MAPEQLDLKPYLSILRCRLSDGERLRGLAFPYILGVSDVVEMLWSPVRQSEKLFHRTFSGEGWVKLASDSSLMALIDRRVLTLSPQLLLKEGVFDAEVPLTAVSFFQLIKQSESGSGPRTELATSEGNIRWVSPELFVEEKLAGLARTLDRTGREPVRWACRY